MLPSGDDPRERWASQPLLKDQSGEVSRGHGCETSTTTLPSLKSVQTSQLAITTSPSVNPPIIGPPLCTTDKPPPEPTFESECWLAVMAWRLTPRGFAAV